MRHISVGEFWSTLLYSCRSLRLAASMHSSLSSDLWFLWLVQVQLCKPKSSCLAALPTRLYFSIHSFPATCVWVVGAAVSPGSLTHTSQELRSVRESRLCPRASVSTTCFKRPAGAQTSSTGSSRCGAAVQVGAPHLNSRRGFNLFLMSCHEL